MSRGSTMRDFIAWLGDVWAALAPRPLSKTALSVTGTDVMLLRRTAAGYIPDRPAERGDRAPLLLGSGQALTLRVEISPEIALHGQGAARIEAARLTPFPLDQAATALERAPEAWANAAPWRFAAVQKSRLHTLKEAARAAGAIPGPAFTLFDETPVMLERTRARALPLAALLTALIILAALLSVTHHAERLERAGEARIAAARSALDRAEADAAAAETERKSAAQPLHAARAAAATRAAAPSAGQALAEISRHMPDTAHLRRLMIEPGRAEGAFIAPDAAALAALLADTPPIASARLRSGAQAEGATGLQRATLEMTLERAP